jgi:ABC-type polysaccharide/polyol phosphate transport system ATPase subunit
MVAIQAKQLTKVYRCYDRRIDLIMDLLHVNRRLPQSRRPALEDVSFTVEAGECVGVIGRNGAGKSTLLKLLAGVSAPTSGSLEVHGNVTTLLELGTGFHPDYSGVENVRINGMLLGLSRREVETRLPAIVEFAELGEVINEPVRTYSSGMQSRLAFAITTALQPDILLIDEVLAVGDAYFVDKCIHHLQGFIRNGGAALVVSHNTFLVSRLCQKALWLEQGKLLRFDVAQDVCRAYERYVRQLERVQQGGPRAAVQGHRWGSGEVLIRSVRVLDNEDREESSFFRGERMVVRVAYEASSLKVNPSLYILITRHDGTLATSCFSEDERIELGTFQGTGYVDVVFDPLLLGDGTYWLTVGIFPQKTGAESIYRMDPFDHHDQVCQFTVKRPDRPLQTVFDHPVQWSHKRAG